jgi:subtilisin family serine protease
MAKKRAARKPPADAIPRPTDKDGRLSVLIELRHQPGASGSFARSTARAVQLPSFDLDENFEPVSLSLRNSRMGMGGGETYVVRGAVTNESDLAKLRNSPGVAGVWLDTPIAPFPGPDEDGVNVEIVQSPAAAACPIPPCDCAPGTPKGTIADVAAYLGVDRIWNAGFRGAGMVVGVLDGGITAVGRTLKPGEGPRRIGRVIGGWPTNDWGTEASQWSEHGNMCATDVLGMAPDAQIYDLRISGAGGSPGTISRALQCFQWAITSFRTNGTPQVLTNSWGIFQETWDSTYARDPNHPFTRKVVEAINEGILVLFAAGNCGDTCPDGRCGPDIGPGRSIWGANGHPHVMTVGAVNKDEQFIGYSSRGPAALDPNKPDFCSISHFTGYFNSDSGTSAATPILAGVVALLKQAKPAATQAQIKAALKATAKDIGAAGFDQHSGSGIVRPFTAYQRLTGQIIRTLPPVCVRPTLEFICRRTLLPICTRPTTTPECVRPTLVTCPPRTFFPPCRPTLTCPRPTTTPDCLRPTLVTCPPRTLSPVCTRPTLFCPPRPTLACPPRPTLACPRPTLACGAPGPGFESYYDPWSGWDPYASWYGAGPEAGYGVDPSEYYGDAAYDWSQAYGDEAAPSGEEWYDESSGWDPEGQT